jgi:hypothetical protein
MMLQQPDIRYCERERDSERSPDHDQDPIAHSFFSSSLVPVMWRVADLLVVSPRERIALREGVANAHAGRERP